MASFMLSVEIQVMNYFYKNLAVLTTKWENHRTDTIFEDVLIAKLAIFLASSNPGSLFHVFMIDGKGMVCTTNRRSALILG